MAAALCLSDEHASLLTMTIPELKENVGVT
jgi:hypothetical protein